MTRPLHRFVHRARSRCRVRRILRRLALKVQESPWIAQGVRFPAPPLDKGTSCREESQGVALPLATLPFSSLPGLASGRMVYSSRDCAIVEPGTPTMSEVTRILSAAAQGDPQAASQLLPLVYDELRQLAAHR